ncbi:MAG: lytic transglycosylase domain-containing protein [Pseudomonadota bacterium]
MAVGTAAQAASTALLPPPAPPPSVAPAPQNQPTQPDPPAQDVIAIRPADPAQPDPQTPEEIATLCDRAALQVAGETDVPLDVLRAITRTETGRRLGSRFTPWPWTINMEGKGVWFDSRAEAIAYAQKAFDRGARSFDMGCFQVNYRWHGQHFADLATMMDPLASARYAARFLTELQAESGDWDLAAGHYHSRLPKFANRYRARFRELKARLPALAESLTPLAPGRPVGPEAAPPRLAARLVAVTLPATPGAVRLHLPAPSGGLLTAGRALFD